MNHAIKTLSGRTALITGASKGIGAGIAKTFAEAGANLLLVARSQDQLALQVKMLSSTGVSVRAISADLSKREDLDRIVQEAGAIDILVNNAAIKQRYMRISNLSEEYWREAHEVGFWAPCLLMREFSRGMIERKRGVIINMSSTGGMRALPYLGHYSSCKAALDMVTRAAAIELGPYGVRVVSIAPGLIDTDHHNLKDKPGVSTPVGRIGTTDDIGKLALFLAQDDSSFISGHVYVCDGATMAGEFSRTAPPYMALVE